MRLSSTHLVLTTALALAAGLPAQEGPTLKVGDPAPALDVAVWLKGEGVTSFQPGQAYVLDFWATWCPPSKEHMPHLSKLQAELGDQVVILGLSDEEQEVAKGFLDQPSWAGKTNYMLGTDPDHSVYTDYLKAAGWKGVPVTFLIDREGKIAWFGDPSEMDAPLSEMLKVALKEAPPEKEPEDKRVALMKLEFASTPAAQEWIDKATAILTAELAAWDYEMSATILIGMSESVLQEAKLIKSGFMMRGGEAGMRQVSTSYFKMAGLPAAEEDKTTIVLHEGMYYVDQEAKSPMMGEVDGRISAKNASLMSEKFAGPFDIPLQGLLFDPNPVNADPGIAFPDILNFCSLDLVEETETEVILRGEGSPLLDLNTLMGGEPSGFINIALRIDRATGQPLQLKVGNKDDNPIFAITFSNFRKVDLEDPAAIHGDCASKEWDDLQASIRKQLERMEKM
ncbi:MAG: TlpA family protein disulfide reductase [Planctomycetota bacterium]